MKNREESWNFMRRSLKMFICLDIARSRLKHWNLTNRLEETAIFIHVNHPKNALFDLLTVWELSQAEMPRELNYSGCMMHTKRGDSWLGKLPIRNFFSFRYLDAHQIHAFVYLCFSISQLMRASKFFSLKCRSQRYLSVYKRVVT